MSKNFLICTPIKKSWPNDKKNNLFFVSESAVLGLKGIHDRYSNYTINDSRWINKKIFSKDFNFLIKIYEKYLAILSKELNKYHKKKLFIKILEDINWTLVIYIRSYLFRQMAKY